MTFEDYQYFFKSIIDGHYTEAPYNQPLYLNYVRLNESRQKRWLKTGELSEETIDAVYTIESKQFWTVVTEPWCGDASHIIPFIEKMAELNDKITIDYELRDDDDLNTIDNFLTNGGRSIPILIARDANKQDLWHWGPRPADAQFLYLKNKNSLMSNDEQKLVLQNWYNDDKGEKIQREISGLIIGSKK